MNNNENSNLFSGKSLRLGGSRKILNEGDNYFGDLSAILIDNLPLWAEMMSTPNSEISLMNKWDEKLSAIIETTTNEDVTSLAGVPSWMLIMLNKILKKKSVIISWNYGKTWRFIFMAGLTLNLIKINSKKF